MTSRGLTGPAGLVTAALVCSALAGCSSDTDSYCAAVRDHKAELTELSDSAGEPGSEVMTDSLGVFGDLADRAPEDLTDEWDTFLGAWEGLTTALDASGADVTDFDPEQRPDGMGSDEFAAVKRAAAELTSPQVVEAAGGIEQHALDVCKVDLSTGGLDF